MRRKFPDASSAGGRAPELLICPFSKNEVSRKFICGKRGKDHEKRQKLNSIMHIITALCLSDSQIWTSSR